MLPLCGKGKRSGVLTNFAEVLSVAHRPMVKRQNISGGAPLTHKIYRADGAHPRLYQLVYLLLMRNVALWVRKGLRAMRKGTIFHLMEKSPYFVAGAQARTINMSGAAPSFLPTGHNMKTVHRLLDLD